MSCITFLTLGMLAITTVQALDAAGAPYRDQIAECISLTFNKMMVIGLSSACVLAYQCRVGHIPLKPYMNDFIVELSETGYKVDHRTSLFSGFQSKGPHKIPLAQVLIGLVESIANANFDSLRLYTPEGKFLTCIGLAQFFKELENYVRPDSVKEWRKILDAILPMLAAAMALSSIYTQGALGVLSAVPIGKELRFEGESLLEGLAMSIFPGGDVHASLLLNRHFLSSKPGHIHDMGLNLVIEILGKGVELYKFTMIRTLSLCCNRHALRLVSKIALGRSAMLQELDRRIPKVSQVILGSLIAE